jgi:hypothetical protein
MLALWSCGRRGSVVQAQRQIHRALGAALTIAATPREPTPPSDNGAHIFTDISWDSGWLLDQDRAFGYPGQPQTARWGHKRRSKPSIDCSGRAGSTSVADVVPLKAQKSPPLDGCNCELASAGTLFRDGQLTGVANNPCPLSKSQSDESRKETPVTDYTMPNFRDLARFRSLHARRRSLSEPTEADEAIKLSGGAPIGVALFLSLGLWGLCG